MTAKGINKNVESTNNNNKATMVSFDNKSKEEYVVQERETLWH